MYDWLSGVGLKCTTGHFKLKEAQRNEVNSLNAAFPTPSTQWKELHIKLIAMKPPRNSRLWSYFHVMHTGFKILVPIHTTITKRMAVKGSDHKVALEFETFDVKMLKVLYQ